MIHRGVQLLNRLPGSLEYYVNVFDYRFRLPGKINTNRGCHRSDTYGCSK